MSNIPRAPSANPNLAILNSLQIEIKSAQSKLTKRLNEIGNIRRQTYTRIFYYIVIVLAMIFFAYVILRDVYRVLTLYYSNNPSVGTAKVAADDDDNEYPADGDNARSISRQVLNGLDVANTNIETTFKPLVDFRERNNLRKTLFTRANNHTLGNEDDTYVYDGKDGASFWSMLFEKPGYYSIVNSDPRNAVGI